MAKVSSYKKLKDKNKALQSHIDRLMTDKEFLVSELTAYAIAKDVAKDVADRVWYGSHSSTTFSGIFNDLTK